ncbi:hypothetical protein ACIP98_18895 [Streptomyces sp. NPDC088354]|uniref:hypothetical protein n=1 Tax=Streptomyces sp. NPDC088354 TaxID=3365856 RepID=UPI00382A70ED
MALAAHIQPSGCSGAQDVMVALAATQSRLLTPPGNRNPGGGDETARRHRHRAAVVAAVAAMTARLQPLP